MWTFMDFDRWFDFKGFLFSKGYAEFIDGIVVNFATLKQQCCRIVGDTFKATFKASGSVCVEFLGEDMSIGEVLVSQYMDNIPEDCRYEIYKSA